ncbi:MAG TPA: BON domain-containing protein [Steroidobacteraceae bacterium]|nr:BON domain-containing protein [Steroidobacteraceae bacterium]
MKSDIDIKNDVDNELKWNPELDATDIATKATSGTVTLSGFAQNAYEKHVAEVTAKRVAGVAAVANDLAVRPIALDRRSDPEIARHVVETLKQELPVSWENIKTTVHEGRVVLEGTLEWQFMRERVENAVRRLRGVLDLRSHILVRPALTGSDVKTRIEAAFKRNALIDANHVRVDVHGTEVTLTGEVRSWAERDQASQAAWSAPGVMNVVDALSIRT